MPNITLAVSDEVYRAARIWAAAHGTTVSAVVRKVLQNLPDRVEDLPTRITSLTEEISCPAHRLEPFDLMDDLQWAPPPLKSEECSGESGEAPGFGSQFDRSLSPLLVGKTTPSPPLHSFTVSQYRRELATQTGESQSRERSWGQQEQSREAQLRQLADLLTS